MSQLAKRLRGAEINSGGADESESEVRKQAMFWLGQSEDARALDFFEKV